eukprot:TRINITY_DN3165_c0_g1_i2.p1 TRINITY_DN3165_c0_g1~~TRINITY_DN3165_c0_g1_i2.p1  ORF type:complete len:305 (-),score=33.42 TRINITY_DN3165_c0_g1_i2:130-1044(-)
MYLALADCNAKEGINVTHYTVHFTNPAPDSLLKIWYIEFPFNLQGLGQAHVVFMTFHLFLLIFHAYAIWWLKRNDEYISLVQVVTTVIVMMFFANLLYTVYYVMFSSSGVGSSGLAGFARVLLMFGELFLMYLCILISKGWSVTTNHISKPNLFKILLVIISIFYFAFVLWGHVGADPADTVYFYQSSAGYLIITLRILLAGWFCWNLYETHQIEKVGAKLKFYLYFAVLYFQWFMFLPVLVFISLGIDPWHRERLVEAISLVEDALALSCFVFLFWPTRISQYFQVTSQNRALLSEDPIYSHL